MEYDLTFKITIFTIVFRNEKTPHFPGSQKHKMSQIHVLITIVGKSTFCERAVKNEALFAKQTTR